MSTADEKLIALILDQYRGQHPGSHLAHCDGTRVLHPEGDDGQYGCDTGCDYFNLEATLECPHESERWTYGDFGQIAWLIEDMERF